MRKSAHGFTLVELLVVIAIMAIIGVYVLSNYSSFGEDQKLKNAVLDIVSILRQAQTNATSGAKCQGVGELGWFVDFTNNQNLNLKCKNSTGISGSLKPLSFSGSNAVIFIDNMTAGISSCVFNSTNTITFAPPFGTMVSSCGTGLVTITLRNNKISTNCTDLTKCKQIIIEQGGRIYAN